MREEEQQLEGNKTHTARYTEKIQVKKEAFITVGDQCYPQAFQREGGFGTLHLLKTGPKGGFIFDSLYILGKINIPRVPEPAWTGNEALITICC